MTDQTVTEADLCALVLAAGRGDRMGADRPKQYLEVGDPENPRRTVLDLLLASYQSASEVGAICLVYGEDDPRR